MPQFKLTEQDYAIMALISKGEAVSGDPYNSVWPGTKVSGIKESTLKQIRDFQHQRNLRGFVSDATGKYQFIGLTLWGCKWDIKRSYDGCNNDLVKYAGVSLDTIFSPDFQDWLIIQRLYQIRKYKEWQEGRCTYKHITDNDIAFQIRLCQEIASLPLPVNIDGKIQGKSYYNGTLNKATGHSGPDEVYRELQRIRGLGPGEIKSLPIQTGQGLSAGLTTYDQARISYGGGQTLYGASSSSRNITTVSSELPSAEIPYEYEKIDPEDTRYDFRTGKKVVDLMIFGTGAASSVVYGAPSTDIGYDGFGDCIPVTTSTVSQPSPVTVGYDEGEVDPGLAAAAGIATTSDPSVVRTLPSLPPVNIPQNAIVSEEATQEDAIDLSQEYSLMGIFGAPDSRRVLIRLNSKGTYAKPEIGQNFDESEPNSPVLEFIGNDFVRDTDGNVYSLPPEEKREDDDSRNIQENPGEEDRTSYLETLTTEAEQLANASGNKIYEPRNKDDTESLINVRLLEIETFSKQIV